VFAGQAVGINEVHDDIWLVGIMDFDFGYFDLETSVLEPLENPFGPTKEAGAMLAWLRAQPELP